MLVYTDLNSDPDTMSAIAPPPVRETKKEPKKIEQPTLDISVTQRTHPKCHKEESVMASLGIDPKGTLGKTVVNLPDYYLDRGLYLIPFYGLSVKQLLEVAEKKGVAILQYVSEPLVQTMLDHTCSKGWSFVELKPIHAINVRNRHNGQHYHESSFADALAIMLHRIIIGGDPFVLDQTKLCRFMIGKNRFWIEFDPAKCRLSIMDDVHQQMQGFQFTFQQISENQVL